MEKTVLQELNESIKAAEKAGRIDTKTQGAVIAAARKLAAMMDEPSWPIVRGKIDNVSPSVFLKYCEALKLMEPIPKEPAKRTKKTNNTKVVDIVGNSKWKKAANANN
jgi:hypothetical protein